MIRVGNAPCSWGVEFADDPRNPSWKQVLRENAEAGYKGIELGPVGFMPEDASELAEGLAEHDLTLIGGVVFRPFHDPAAWDDTMDGAVRTCRALKAHGAEHLVLIDSISPRRAPTAGRASEAEQMDAAEWAAYKGRIETVARMGAEEYGLTVGIHAHAAGSYAGFDPVAFMKRHMPRISYMHFKDVDPAVKADVIAKRTGFYDACGQGIFCNLGDGDVDFTAVRQTLLDAGFEGWCTVEQDCDPEGDTSPVDDARVNRRYLESIGF